ncbi:MAG TPA: FecR family protein [Pedobacter sp.]
MEAEQFKDLLKRHEENKLSPEEKLLLDRWYDSYAAESFNGFSNPGHAERIREEMRSVIMSRQPEKSIRRPLWRILYTAAATLTLFVSAWLLFNGKSSITVLKEQEQFTIFSTSATESKVLTLQDNSIVHLNPSSTLKLNRRFGTLAKREVFLEKGNAFFEVTKDPRHPFIVHAKQLNTRVLGTKFKVSNNPDRTTEVSVSEGKVKVFTAHKVLATLPAGEKLIFSQDSRTWKKSDFGISENNLWYKSVHNLNHADFAEVARIVKIDYGIRLRSLNPNTVHYKYNLQIRSERTLDQTIKMICSVHRNKYRRTKDGIVIY